MCCFVMCPIKLAAYITGGTVAIIGGIFSVCCAPCLACCT